jgi:hypothetical protein
VTSRRQVLGAGLALSVLPRAGSGQSWREPPDPVPLLVSTLLVDARFADAVALATRAATAGINTTDLERDVLGLWHDELLPALIDGRVAAFGGITTDTSLFLFRTLAADQRMRVVYRANHCRPLGGVVRHALAGSARTISRITGSSASNDWRLRFGEAFGACHVAGRSVKRTVLTPSVPGGPREVTLLSWVIAPITVAAPM